MRRPCSVVNKTVLKNLNSRWLLLIIVKFQKSLKHLLTWHTFTWFVQKHILLFSNICRQEEICLQSLSLRISDKGNIGNLNASGKRPFTGKEFSVFARIIVQSFIVDSLIFIGTWAERATFSSKGKTLPFFQNHKFCFKL